MKEIEHTVSSNTTLRERCSREASVCDGVHEYRDTLENCVPGSAVSNDLQTYMQ